MTLVKGVHDWIMAFMYSEKTSPSVEGHENESSSVIPTNIYKRVYISVSLPNYKVMSRQSIYSYSIDYFYPISGRNLHPILEDGICLFPIISYSFQILSMVGGSSMAGPAKTVLLFKCHPTSSSGQDCLTF